MLTANDPLVQLTKPNYTLPGLPGTSIADDSIAAKQAALRSQVLGALSTVLSAPAASTVLLDTGQLAAGAYRVRFVAKCSPNTLAAVDKGVRLVHRNAANAADIETVARVPARPNTKHFGGSILETVLDLATNERVRLETDGTLFATGEELLVVLDVSPA
jgi:hypothetical protein